MYLSLTEMKLIILLKAGKSTFCKEDKRRKKQMTSLHSFYIVPLLNSKLLWVFFGLGYFGLGDFSKSRHS